MHFNSHAHVERDLVKNVHSPKSIISTHTLTWSVTLASPLYHFTILISTHTLTWSVTPSGSSVMSQYDISTHTLTWSVTSENLLNT